MLKDNSKLIKKGDIFIALKGIENDGHDYIEEAIKNGAKMIICEHGKYDIDTVECDDTKLFLTNYLKLFFPDIKVIGVTGTNGKTTTAYLIYQALNKLNIKCAYIGTIGFYLDEKIKDLVNTTPSSLELYNMIEEAYKNNYEYVVMEVSSHSLSQGRCDFIDFSYTIFTNLSRDHLDFHKTMHNYALAKQRLFKDLSHGINIINNDLFYTKYFKIGNYVTYGFKKSDYQISMKKGFSVNNSKYRMNLYGKYNVYNMSAVITFLKVINIKDNDIKKVVSLIHAPEGRMQVINYLCNKIIIDYAHTPDAMKNVINSLDNYNNLYIVFGCGGQRDKTKRPLMGKIASMSSKYVIITNDNPRFEDEKIIINDILKGIKKYNYEIELNRKKAIKKGIHLLKNNDILLVLGKGHEKYQILKDKKVYFSDMDEVLKCIRR